MTRICDYDEAFTRQEMYEETGHCLKCKANPKCPMHIKAIEEEYGVKVRTDGRRRKMTEAEKAYQYFVIAVPENEEQAKAYFWARKALQSTLTQPAEDNNVPTNEPNEPLMLEELREMDGQPVWVEDVKHWALIDIEKGGQWDGVPFAIWAENGAKFTYNVESRGLHCYRRPPGGEEETP